MLYVFQKDPHKKSSKCIFICKSNRVNIIEINRCTLFHVQLDEDKANSSSLFLNLYVYPSPYTFFENWPIQMKKCVPLFYNLSCKANKGQLYSFIIIIQRNEHFLSYGMIFKCGVKMWSQSSIFKKLYI